MIVYAIRHKPTGAFMPARMFRTHGRGWTHWIPEPEGKEYGLQGYDKNPRIFWTRRTANNAITMWLKGPMEQVNTGEGWDQSSTLETVKPKVPRKSEEIELVLFNLVELY